jgi:hypothetical protein
MEEKDKLSSRIYNILGVALQMADFAAANRFAFPAKPVNLALHFRASQA